MRNAQGFEPSHSRFPHIVVSLVDTAHPHEQACSAYLYDQVSFNVELNIALTRRAILSRVELYMYPSILPNRRHFPPDSR
jgi:hypothetical protein